MAAVRWLGMKKERKLYDMCMEHMRKSQQAADLLKLAITDLCDGKYDELGRIAEDIIHMTRETDEMARQMRHEAGSSTLDPAQRQELMNILFHIQRVSDGIEASAYRIEMAEGMVVPKELVSLLKDLVDAVIETCTSLTNALERIAYDWHDAMDDVEKVLVGEQKVDDIRRRAMRILVEMADKIGISTFWRIEEIIKHLEDATDACEESANVLTLVITSRIL